MKYTPDTSIVLRESKKNTTRVALKRAGRRETEKDQWSNWGWVKDSQDSQGVVYFSLLYRGYERTPRRPKVRPSRKCKFYVFSLDSAKFWYNCCEWRGWWMQRRGSEVGYRYSKWQCHRVKCWTFVNEIHTTRAWPSGQSFYTLLRELNGRFFLLTILPRFYKWARERWSSVRPSSSSFFFSSSPTVWWFMGTFQEWKSKK